MTYRVRLTSVAESDLGRLFDFVLYRELERDGGDLALADRAVAAIRKGFATLRSSPFSCRKAGTDPFQRELIIPFGRSGYVALFEIESATDVLVLTIRHQLEEDYY